MIFSNRNWVRIVVWVVLGVSCGATAKILNTLHTQSNINRINSVFCEKEKCFAGGYHSNQSTIFPLLAMSEDGGKTWDNKIQADINLPNEYESSGSFNAINCSASYCIAAGQYHNGSNIVPMLVVSTDGGYTWNYKIQSGIGLPPHFTVGSFNVAACTENNCLIGGSYKNGENTTPALLLSTDGGNNWYDRIQIENNLPKHFISFGNFSSITCSGTHCIAAGQYNNGITTVPMLAVSLDEGNNWDYRVDSEANLPNDFVSSGSFLAVSCDDQVCAAGGQYLTENASVPMLISSTDGGMTWNYKIQANINLPNLFESRGIIRRVSCSNNTCLAGGQYYTGINNVPMLLISNDSANSWNYIVESDMNLPLDFEKEGDFYDVNCFGQTCVAVGYYNKDSQNFPILNVSIDDGHTWNYNSLNDPSIDSKYDIFLNNVSCHVQNCVSSGFYRTHTSDFVPLFAVSQDKGTNWNYNSLFHK